MRDSVKSLGRLSLVLVLGAAAVGCGSSGDSNTFDATTDASVEARGPSSLGEVGRVTGNGDAGPLGSGTPDVFYGADAFFATDPPPKYCGVDGGTAPATPGGTPQCPSDKNREGCPCPVLNQSAPCWPGLRVDRGIGQCKDGTTTCTTRGESFSQVWGPCVGYALPTPGATGGAAACKCFSAGQWNLTDLSPCFIQYSSGSTYAVSSYLVDGGIACPNVANTPPPTPQPGVPWSTDTLKVDCAGHFTLCYTIKAGSATAPKATDCIVGWACVAGDYPTANVVQPFPPLAGWVGKDPACAAQFEASGGYGEMSVKGLSEMCEPIGANDGGTQEVFNRVPYCPAVCQTNPSATGCAGCQSGGSGTFGN